MAAPDTTDSLVTAEAFAQRPDPGFLEELVRGKIVPVPHPTRRKGQICTKIILALYSCVEAHDLGHILSNHSGVITERDPDTVRGADVAFYSYSRLPKGPLPATCGPEVPELVFEVRSPNDRWPKVLGKTAEYRNAGVLFVIVLDDERCEARVYGADGTNRVLGTDDELMFPEILGDFRVRVRQFFE